MSRFFIPAVGALGLVGPLWAFGVAPAGPLATSVLALIAIGILAGVVELFLRTKSLDALEATLPQLQSTDEIDAAIESGSGPLVALIRARLRGEPALLPRAEILPYLGGGLVVLGVLGTVIGLNQALGGAGSVLAAADGADALKAALLAPLAGLSLAFGTTVAGVAGSTSLGVAGLILRRKERRIEDVVERAFEGSLSHLTPQGRQVKALERLSGDESPLLKAATSLETVLENLPRLDEGMSERQKALATTLQDSVAESTKKMSDAVAESLKNVGAAHEAALDKTLGTVLSALTERIESMQKAQEEAAAKTAESLSTFSSTLERQLKKAAELDEQLKKLEEQAAARVAEKAEAAVAALQKASAEREGALFEKLDERNLQSQRRIDELASQIVALTEGSKQQLEALDETLARERQKSEAATAERIGGLIERMEQQLSARGEELIQLGTRGDERSARLLDDLRLLFDNHAADMSGSLAHAAKTVQKGADALEAGGVELEALADRLTVTIDAHRDAARSFTDRLASLEILLRELNRTDDEERLSDYLDQTREAFDRSTEASRELVGVLQNLKSQPEVPTAAGEPLEEPALAEVPAEDDKGQVGA